MPICPICTKTVNDSLPRHYPKCPGMQRTHQANVEAVNRHDEQMEANRVAEAALREQQEREAAEAAAAEVRVVTFFVFLLVSFVRNAGRHAQLCRVGDVGRLRPP